MIPTHVGEVTFTPKVVDALVRSLAQNIDPIGDLINNFGLTPAALGTLLGDPDFREKLRQARLEWNLPENTTVRTRRKIDALVEESLPRLYHFIHDPHIPPSEAIKAIGMAKNMSTAERERDELRSADRAQGGGGAQTIELNITFPWGGGEQAVLGRSPGEAIEGEATRIIEYVQTEEAA